jgi:heme exporter protein D
VNRGMDLGPHAGFIVAAYAVALAIVGGLIAWIVIDHRAQTRILEDLERAGVTRRSAAAREEVS